MRPAQPRGAARTARCARPWGRLPLYLIPWQRIDSIGHRIQVVSPPIALAHGGSGVTLDCVGDVGVKFEDTALRLEPMPPGVVRLDVRVIYTQVPDPCAKAFPDFFVLRIAVRSATVAAW